jgi:lambda family phage portal protein
VVHPAAAVRRGIARSQMKVLATFNSSPATGTALNANEGASVMRRALRRWLPWSSRNPDDEVLIDRPELVARSRDAYRNQGIARSAVSTMLTSVIGSGLELHCRIDREFLGFTDDDEATAWEKNTERLFRAWANSTDADSRRRNTFYRLQCMAYKCSKHTGEIFALLPLIPRKNTICNLRVQLVEADRISNPLGTVNGPLKSKDGVDIPGSVWDGVETGVWGEPLAYWVETTIPIPYVEMIRTWKRVQAYGTKSGRRQVIHFYEEERPGQRRGLPFLSPILEMLKQISRYSEAELAAAVISGMFTVFVKHDDPDADPLQGLTSGELVSNSPGPGADGSVELRSGAIIDLQKGEDISIANPGRPNQQFGPFVTEIIRQIGMATNIPYELLTKQFTASYSASRAAIMLGWEFFKTERGWFVQEFLAPIYAEWLAEMVAGGRIEAPGFFDDVEIQRAYCEAKWYGPVAPQIDPVKEANAIKTRLDTLVTTLAEETENLNGGDWEKNLNQRKRENVVIEKCGLVAQTPIPADQIPVFPE